LAAFCLWAATLKTRQSLAQLLAAYRSFHSLLYLFKGPNPDHNNGHEWEQDAVTTAVKQLHIIKIASSGPIGGVVVL
jgi:hypothetical protein